MLNVFAVKGAKKIGINESIIYKFLIKGYFLCPLQSPTASATLRNIAGIIEENQQINAIEIEI